VRAHVCACVQSACSHKNPRLLYVRHVWLKKAERLISDGTENVNSFVVTTALHVSTVLTRMVGWVGDSFVVSSV
jgi:hypothetical protein